MKLGPNPFHIAAAALASMMGVLLCSSPAAAATYTVTTTADDGPGSLRQAISDANANPGLDRIEFNISSGDVVKTIAVSVGLGITDPVTIDGSSQPGYVGAPIVVVTAAPPEIGLPALVSPYGLAISAGGTTIHGLVVHGFSMAEVAITGTGNRVTGCYLGVDADGVTPRGTSTGLQVTGNDTVVGGPTAAERNVLSGNRSGGVWVWSGVTGTQIIGNYIGVGADGVTPVPNSSGVYAGARVTVGGTSPGERNVISGNVYSGLNVQAPGADGTIIQGNYIGTDATGTRAVPNRYGVSLRDVSNAVVGGPSPGAGNLVSGNTDVGVSVSTSWSQNGGSIVQGNRVGLSADGQATIPNGIGVLIYNEVIGEGVPGLTDALRATIGGTAPSTANIIAGNRDGGVVVKRGRGHRVLGNQVFGNGASGATPQIDLGGDGPTLNDPGDADSGPNHLQNHPSVADAAVDAGVLIVKGELRSAPGLAGVRVELFGGQACPPSGRGEARRFLGFAAVSTDAVGFGAFTVTVASVPAGVASVTATATTADGDTSELSPCVMIATAPPLSSGREPGAGSTLSGSGRPTEAPTQRVPSLASGGVTPPAPAPARR
ncbi:MAG: hypothetical protein U0821_12495 [Chloroflexota bacterium]